MDDHDAINAQMMRISKGVERRSEVYGNSNVTAAPLRERNNAVENVLMPMSMVRKSVSGRQITERKQQLSVAHKTTVKSTKLNMDSKENIDMAFEINIPTGTDVQVQIEVKDDVGNIISCSPLKRLVMKSSDISENSGTSSAACICAINSVSRQSPSPGKNSLTWHKSVMDALELHELRRRDINKDSARQSTIDNERNIFATTAPSKSDVSKANGLVAQRTAIFEQQNDEQHSSTLTQQQKDPAELSLQERFELFERNKGTALIPKAALGMAPSTKQLQLADSNASTSSQQIAQDTQEIREHEMSILLNLLNCNENAELNRTQPSAPPMSEPKNADRPTKRHSDANLNVSSNVRDAIEDVKRVKVNPPKIGHMYPSLSDADSDDVKHVQNDTSKNGSFYPSLVEFDSDAKFETSEIENDVDLSTSQHENDENTDDDDSDAQSKHTYSETETQSSNGECSGIDEYLDEAFDGDNDDEHDYYNLKKSVKKDLNTSGSISSNSFSYEKQPSKIVRYQAITEEKPTELLVKSPIKLRSTVSATDSKSPESMVYTVDAYRRQQLVVGKNLYQKIDESDASANSDGNDDEKDDHIQSQAQMVDAKIEKLLENAEIQQQQIVQASNALNICASTIEFSGSFESVVAEWKLLIATHSRQAIQNEVARLRAEHYLRSIDAPKECGRLTVKEITLPLKQEFINKLQEDQKSGQHLVCLLKYNEQVVATKTVRTLSGLLSVRFPDILRIDNVYVDFKVALEIYGMEAQREALPHSIKYRIKNKKGIIKTPKKCKKLTPDLIMPSMPSPAGSKIVRQPSFVCYGCMTFTLREAKRTNWTLDMMSDSEVSNPLFGNVYMEMKYEFSVNIDHKGFLTMFNDISGFGAWHRRWCHLHSDNSNNVLLSYWKYPDDERKSPIGSLDLSACEQKTISMAPRELCVRPNTMLLELKRPRHEDDQDSLILVTKDDHTIVRHLLSADTKEERNEWIAHFTKALALMRGVSAQR